MRRKLRVGRLNGEHRRKPLASIVSARREFIFLRVQFFFDVAVQRARQRGSKTRHMRAAVALWNIVRVTEHVFLIAIVPLQGRFNFHVVFHYREMKNGWMNRRLVAIQMVNEGLDAALILKQVFSFFALIDQANSNAGIKKR